MGDDKAENEDQLGIAVTSTINIKMGKGDIAKTMYDRLLNEDTATDEIMC